MPKEHLDAFARGLKIILESEGHKMKPLSIAAGMGESGIRDLFRYASAPKVSNAYAIARELSRSVDEIIEIGLSGQITKFHPPQSISIAGRVGAGAQVPLVDHTADGGLFQVAAPAQLLRNGTARDFGAVEVEGDSMAPMYQPGDILFFARHTHDGIPDEDIGRPCIVEDADGMAWVKQVKRGAEPGLFHLISLNPDAETRHNVRIKWAARVMMVLPAEMVERI
ncbi:S24 family peptidase [Paracoccus sulfuroxidans]|nr:S24 family peptidase [Paracoccus sulfuroxidans]